MLVFAARGTVGIICHPGVVHHSRPVMRICTGKPGIFEVGTKLNILRNIQKESGRQANSGLKGLAPFRG